MIQKTKNTFYTLNSNGLNTYKKKVALFDSFKDVKFDIIFLQETRFIKNQRTVSTAKRLASLF